MELELGFYVQVSGFGKVMGQEWGHLKDLEGVKGQAEFKGQGRGWLRVGLGVNLSRLRGEGWGGMRSLPAL